MIMLAFIQYLFLVYCKTPFAVTKFRQENLQQYFMVIMFKHSSSFANIKVAPLAKITK